MTAPLNMEVPGSIKGLPPIVNVDPIDFDRLRTHIRQLRRIREHIWAMTAAINLLILNLKSGRVVVHLNLAGAPKADDRNREGDQRKDQ